MKTLTAFFYSVTIDRALAGTRARVADFSGMKEGEKVLDVCCGTGAQTTRFARRGIISWGIDMDSRMIEFAEKRRRRLGLNGAGFQKASAMHLPFRDACFDHASISMGLHEKDSPSVDIVVSEMRRVVKPGGTLTIVDYMVPYPMDAIGLVARLVEKMAGQDHYRCFQEFIKNGGLDSLLSRHQLREEKREHAPGMPMVLLKVRNS